MNEQADEDSQCRREAECRRPKGLGDSPPPTLGTGPTCLGDDGKDGHQQRTKPDSFHLAKSTFI